MYISIGFTDLSSYVNDSAYECNEITKTIEWTDANYDRHRVVTSKKIEGQVEFICSNLTHFTIQQLKQYIEVSKKSGSEKVSIGIEVTNLGQRKTIDCYIDMTVKEHTNSYDIVQLSFKEA